ncbi:MAG: glycosyltransferase family 2 protein [Gemmatimonadaceae bacterium]|jgi:dolichol-phosphate mannosyltransferase|nr:glycosyltransferase family 2 protein [Gemmatimonadaceae bacterium]
MLLTVLIPAHNEGASLAGTVRAIVGVLEGAGIPHEILVSLDHCADDSERVVADLAAQLPSVRGSVNPGPAGYGFAVRHGLDVYRGDAVVIVMADASDDPRDIVAYYRLLEAGHDCAFGSRFIHGAAVRNYPWTKLVLNRAANRVMRLLFRVPYNDFTNAFKCFRREVIDGCRPFLSNHFNLTIELPLKAMVRGYSWAVVPTNWYGREAGESKFLIKEMGSRYVFIILYALIEKYFSRGDYRRDVG